MHYLTLTPPQVIDNSLIDGKQDSLFEFPPELEPW
jgi:hypothetical protein